MPWLVDRRDPYWDVEGANVRRTRTRRHVVAVLVVTLSVVLLALFLARIAAIDAHEVLQGPSRPLVFSALVADTVACAFVMLRELRHSTAG